MRQVETVKRTSEKKAWIEVRKCLAEVMAKDRAERLNKISIC